MEKYLCYEEDKNWKRGDVSRDTFDGIPLLKDPQQVFTTV